MGFRIKLIFIFTINYQPDRLNPILDHLFWLPQLGRNRDIFQDLSSESCIV